MKKFFRVPKNGPNGSTDFDQMFNELRQAGYTFWFDGRRSRDDQEKIERLIATNCNGQPACFKFAGAYILGHNADDETYVDSSYPEVDYRDVLNDGLARLGPAASIHLPTGIVVNQAAISKAFASHGSVFDPYAKVGQLLQTPRYKTPIICMNHVAVETGTLNSFCKFCDHDLEWNKELCKWESK